MTETDEKKRDALVRIAAAIAPEYREGIAYPHGRSIVYYAASILDAIEDYITSNPTRSERVKWSNFEDRFQEKRDT